MKTYRYIGQGRGVPGLPHSLTDIEAMELGVERELADALKAKTYEVVKTAAVETAVENKKAKDEKKEA